VKGVSARAAGLRQGDIILAVGNIPLRSAAQLNNLLKQVPQGRNVALLVKREDSASWVAVRLEDK